MTMKMKMTGGGTTKSEEEEMTGYRFQAKDDVIWGLVAILYFILFFGASAMMLYVAANLVYIFINL